MKLDYSLTPADFVAQATHDRGLVRPSFARLSLIVWGLFFAALLVVSGDALPAVMLVAFVAFVLFQVVATLQRRLWLRYTFSADRLRGLAGDQHIEITDDHLCETAPNRDVTWSWEEYSSIVESTTHVFIKPTPINTIIIPSGAFISESQRAEVVAFVKHCIEKKKT